MNPCPSSYSFVTPKGDRIYCLGWEHCLSTAFHNLLLDTFTALNRVEQSLINIGTDLPKGIHPGQCMSNWGGFGWSLNVLNVNN